MTTGYQAEGGEATLIPLLRRKDSVICTVHTVHRHWRSHIRRRKESQSWGGRDRGRKRMRKWERLWTSCFFENLWDMIHLLIRHQKKSVWEGATSIEDWILYCLKGHENFFSDHGIIHAPSTWLLCFLKMVEVTFILIQFKCQSVMKHKFTGNIQTDI